MPAFGKSARRNPFADTLTASKPSIRENLSDAVGNLLGGSYQARVFGRNLFGAAGATIPQWTAPVNVVPQLWPVGIPLALDEAGQQFGNGNIFSGAANTAMALIPGSAVVRGGKGLVGAAGKKAVQDGAEAFVPGVLRRPRDVPAISGTRAVETPDGYSVPEVSLNERSSLATPLVPTREQMQQFGRVERVPLSSVEAHEPSQFRRWSDFTSGKHPGALVDGYGDLPLAVRRDSGEYILYDGHHRAQRALAQGADGMDMHVIDARSYDPEQAGIAKRPIDPNEVNALLRELGLK